MEKHLGHIGRGAVVSCLLLGLTACGSGESAAMTPASYATELATALSNFKPQSLDFDLAAFKNTLRPLREQAQQLPTGTYRQAVEQILADLEGWQVRAGADWAVVKQQLETINQHITAANQALKDLP